MGTPKPISTMPTQEVWEEIAKRIDELGDRESLSISRPGHKDNRLVFTKTCNGAVVSTTPLTCWDGSGLPERSIARSILSTLRR